MDSGTLVGSEQRGWCPTTYSAVHIRIWRRAVGVRGGSWSLGFRGACLMAIILFPDVVPTAAPFLVHDKPNDANESD